MQFKWVPENVLDEDGNDVAQYFTGHIVIDIKPKLERLKIAQEMHLSVKGGEIEADAIDKLEAMDKIVRDSVKEVALKTLDGQKIQSLDDLESFAEGVQLTQHLLSLAINGMSLGKSLKPSSKQPSDS